MFFLIGVSCDFLKFFVLDYQYVCVDSRMLSVVLLRTLNEVCDYSNRNHVLFLYVLTKKGMKYCLQVMIPDIILVTIKLKRNETRTIISFTTHTFCFW